MNRLWVGTAAAAAWAMWILTGAAAMAAEPLDPRDVPDPLKPWVGWVLDGHETARCPLLQGAGTRACAWPARITLELDESGGRFSQEWRVYGAAWVALPGDAKRWPLDVQAGGVPAAAVRQNSLPRVLLREGTTTVSGRFAWDALPEMLQIPAETGVVSLTVRGRKVDFPARDEQGRLWLQRASNGEEGESRLEVVVHRKVVDEVPLRLVTDVILKVSGKNREALLARALPDGFVPISLEGPIPARIEKDGRLRVQVRPGTWRLLLTARHEGPAAAIKLPALAADAGPWDADEAWVFDARPALRIVSVEGVDPIDAQQTELPTDWRDLPAYLMKPGSTMTLAERRRGDADPAPDRLSLDRTLWLDFDGGGYTVQDRVSGTLSRSWRLEMGPDTTLGRVAIDGRDQLITGPANGAKGIELRQTRVNLEADSRMEGKRSLVSAVSWNHDFESVGGRLHLPPGWRIVYAMGVDRASPTWISEWDLLDLFLLLVLTLSMGKLWGVRYGVLAFVTLTLLWQEPGAPRWTWLFLVVGEAMIRVLPDGFFRGAFRVYRWGVWAILVLLGIPFLVTQARHGLYPQLEPTWRSSSDFGLLLGGAKAPSGGTAVFVPGPDQTKHAGTKNVPTDDNSQSMNGEIAGNDEDVRYQMEEKAADKPASQREQDKEDGYYSRGDAVTGKFRSKLDSLENLYAPDPKAQVSTGPGLPSWSWREVSLSWRGPVTAGQRVRLFLEPPWLRGLLCFLRIALLTVLALLIFGLPPEDIIARARRMFPRAAAAALALGMLAALGGAGSVARASEAETPTPEILNELRQRLLRNPSCAPDCAEAGRMQLEASGSTLRIRVELFAGAATAAPLPGGAQQWSPERVLVDGNAAALVRTADGRMWVALTPGAHQVVLEGRLPDRESVAIPLPLRPHHVEASVSGWAISGVHEDGVPDDNVQLTRLKGTGGGDGAITQEALPPFVRVERELLLGLSWQVLTRVVRLSPPGVPIVLEVPLLPGESVTSAEMRVAGGKAQVSMGPTTSVASWTSVLAEAASIPLVAPKSIPWVEEWRIDASPVWHAEVTGIPPIHSQDSDDARVRVFRPWPGETVTLAVTRPEGAGGSTLTLDGANLALSPGLRATDATLTLSIRASRGAQHTVTMPAGAELTSVALDGTTQPVRQEGQQVTLAIPPGSHSAVIVWREPRGIRLLYWSPKVNAGASVANAEVSVQVPADRWTLALEGPRLGPAVLFWSLLAIYALVSLLLGFVHWTPLRAWHWFLLALGLTQVPIVVAALAVVWLLALGARRARPPKRAELFNLTQIMLPFIVLVGVGCLFGSIAEGLLGLPEMQIQGNGSYSGMLRWYADRVPGPLPEVGVISVPLFVYRLAMLAWALWIAASLLAWLKWGWECYTNGGVWRASPPRAATATPPAAPK